MRIAVISDVHANLIALQTVLKDIEAENCDKVVCLGDLVLAGPQPKETIDFVKSQDWIIIQGNTDQLIVNYGDEVLAMMQENFPIMANAMVEDVKLLDEEDKDYLANLPETLLLNFDGVNTLLVHGSPRANNENIMPNMSIGLVEDVLQGVDADLILCGHTHIPCGYQTSTKQTLVNVGSVGRPMTQQPLACYAVIDFNDGIFSVRHKFVDYDRNTAAQLIFDRGFEGAEKLAELLINPVTRHV